MALLEGSGGRATGVGAGSAAVAFTSISGRGVAALATATRISRGGQTLDDSVPREHAAIDRKVPADHECTHGGVLLSQCVRLIGQVSLILAAIDKD